MEVERACPVAESQEILDNIRRRALDDVNADLEFAMIAPGKPPSQEGRGGNNFTIHGNVGALQTGAGSSAAVTMHFGPSELQSIADAFRELRRLVHKAELPEEQRKPLQETLALAVTEAEKPEPNAITLKALAMGTAVTIQSIGAIPGALEVARRLAALLGFQF